MNESQVNSSPAPTAAGSPSGARPKIGILGHVGDRNLGDEAIIEAFLTRMKSEWPGLEARIYSMHPGDSAQRYGCKAYSIRRANESEREFRPPAMFSTEAGTDSTTADAAAAHVDQPRSLLDRLVPKGRLRSTVGTVIKTGLEAVREIGFLWRSMQRVRGLDFMYVTGSNQFLDNFGGAWGFPYTLLKWTVLCRLVGCRVAFVSVGAGPLDGTLSKWMLARALALADYVSFRDEGSRALVHKGCGHDGPVLPDLAHSLDISTMAAQRASADESHRPLRIAVNAMPVHDPRYWHAPNPELYGAYVRSIGEAARDLLGDGHKVSFFATQFPDASVARDAIAAAIDGDAAASLVVDVPSTVAELMEVLGRADVVVATRFHGILLGLLAGKPTVGICYYRKSRELLAEAGMSDYAIDIDAFDTPQLLAAVRALTQERSDAARRVERKTALYRAELEQQYQFLFRQLTGRGRLV